MQRGLRAMQELMQAEGGAAGMFPAFFDMGLAAPGAEATLTAVDLACCVARDIPCVEAFMGRGLRPSPAALALAEHAVPIMRRVAGRRRLCCGLRCL